MIHCKQWITALNLGAFFEQQFLLNVVCIFCHLELAFSAILTRMVYNLKVLNFAVWWLQFLPIFNMHKLHSESSNFCNLILAIFINSQHACIAYWKSQFLQFNSCNFLLNWQKIYHVPTKTRAHTRNCQAINTSALDHSAILPFLSTNVKVGFMK